MPRRNYHWQDAKFNEYLFEVISNLTQQQKDRLSPVLAAKLKTKEMTKRWINGANLDQKLVFLVSVGIELSLVFYQSGKMDAGLIKRTYNQIALRNIPAQNIKQMLDEKVFVIDSKSIAIALAMMSTNCHGDAYYINKNFLRLGTAINNMKWKVGMAEKNVSRQVLAGQQDIATCARAFFLAMGLPYYLHGKSPLLPADLQVLFLLASTPTTYVTTQFIYRHLAFQHSEALINKTITRLEAHYQYIERLPRMGGERAHIITPTGLLEAAKYMHYMANERLD